MSIGIAADKRKTVKCSGTEDSQPECESQLATQLDLLRDYLLTLETKMSNLKVKLSPVLRDEDVEKCSEGDKADSLVARASEVRDARWRVESLTDTCVDILRRLEV